MATATDKIASIAERVLALLQDRGAIGRKRAIPQAEVAHAIGINTRTLQHATLLLNKRGVPVLSSCTHPMGIFLAETLEEVTEYCDQLQSRLVGNAERLKAIRQIERKKKTEMSVEPDGQRRMCFDAG